MYAETEHLLPYFQNFSDEVHHAKEFCKTHELNSPLNNMVQTSTVYEYNMGGEGDLFKAPEPIIEESILGIDPMMATISMISCGDADFELLQSDQLLSEVFYECKKDLLEKAAIETSAFGDLDPTISTLKTDEDRISGIKPVPDPTIQKSVSSGSLRSMDWIQCPTMKSNLMDFSGVDISSIYGMRRAFSEGDINTLSNGNGNGRQCLSSLDQRPLLVSNCSIEERREKLSRYRNKRTKRNFGRKIKYACRKALADSQPRIKGRFAKTEESEMKRQ